MFFEHKVCFFAEGAGHDHRVPGLGRCHGGDSHERVARDEPSLLCHHRHLGLPGPVDELCRQCPGRCALPSPPHRLQAGEISFVSDKAKRNITFITGFICILQGLLIVSAVSWYAYRVTVEYYDPTIIGAKYELGTALFIGWASALLTLTGGTIIVCSGVGRSYKQPRIALSNPHTSPMLPRTFKRQPSELSAKNYKANMYV
ncbi:claudin-15-like isoform X3 [Petromyzon marinus]|uniref:claudin-15-like isoform X3 n=1 Tax=Petromyzon marinus TaxID=7757 RepID=UPI003F72BF99